MIERILLRDYFTIKKKLIEIVFVTDHNDKGFRVLRWYHEIMGSRSIFHGMYDLKSEFVITGCFYAASAPVSECVFNPWCLCSSSVSERVCSVRTSRLSSRTLSTKCLLWSALVNVICCLWARTKNFSVTDCDEHIKSKFSSSGTHSSSRLGRESERLFIETSLTKKKSILNM